MSDDERRGAYVRGRALAAALEAEHAQLSAQNAALAAENARLDAEKTALERAAATHEAERARLGEQAATLQREAADLLVQNERLREALEEARAIIEDLRRQLFGPKADRLTAEQEAQLQHILRDLKAAAAQPGPVSDEVLTEDQGKTKQKKPPRRQHPRQPAPVHLETETVTLEPADKTCPCCGATGQRIGEDVTEEIDFVPAKLIRRRIVRPKYAHHCGCEDRRSVAVAPLPPRLIPQSKLGVGLAVHIVLTRYDDHLSYYRIEQQLRERHQVVVPRQQMVQWVERIAEWLRPVYDRMWRAMLETGYLQVDETPVRVLDPDVKGKAASGYLWFYAVPRGDVVLAFDRHRSLAPVRACLQTFVGTIQTDAYEVYRSLERHEDGIARIGCLAHVRRRFYAALRDSLADAVWFIDQIRALYRIEDEGRDLDPSGRHTLRQHREAAAIWAEMKSRAATLLPRFLPKSHMGNALSYFLEDYDALIGYLRDGRFEIDNNLIENAIRPLAVGRRRWLFIGHPDAGWRSAVAYSLLVSCRRRRINPYAYLTDVLRRLPGLKITQLDALLPANWTPTTVDTT